MDVPIDNTMPDRCADAPQIPKHVGCKDAPHPHIIWGKHTEVQESMGHTDVWGHLDIWGAFKHTGVSKHMGVYRHTRKHMDTP